MSPYRRAIYKIEARDDGPARAREIVDRELSSALPQSALYDLKLLVSELVTNGIRHGGTSRGELLTLELVINGKIRCAVLDRGRGFVTPRADAVGGWGLRLVEQLADRWGFTRSSEGTQVWIETGLGPSRAPAVISGGA